MTDIAWIVFATIFVITAGLLIDGCTRQQGQINQRMLQIQEHCVKSGGIVIPMPNLQWTCARSATVPEEIK